MKLAQSTLVTTYQYMTFKMWYCSHVIFINDGKIELSNGRGFGQQQNLANSFENFISYEIKKTYLLLPNIYKALKTFLTL